MAIHRVYTRGGDAGKTSLVGGQRVSKADRRIEAYGTLDELNAIVGAAIVELRAEGAEAPRAIELARVLVRVQHELFNAGSLLATLPADIHPRQPRVTEVEVAALETDMDGKNAELSPLASFVLPGGSRTNASLHLARTVCRRAERIVVALAEETEVEPVIIRYLNRLSDALFVWSRWANQLLGAEETLWDPNFGR
ncbi:MAG: cob(I)yrinic acid a,c-diamide adenosyltransferase [Myxococcales bacterium]|nr:cob(I)yrinic acid a,c-diamide adenosyltransferase [Myxococcales bacterium]